MTDQPGGFPPQGQPQYGQPQYGQPQYGQPQYGQPQYGQPPGYGQPPYGWPGQARRNSKGRTGMVLGIVALCTFWIPFLYLVTALPMSILAIVFGVQGRGLAARGEADNPGQALAAVICGSIALGLCILNGLVGAVLGLSGAPGYS